MNKVLLAGVALIIPNLTLAQEPQRGRITGNLQWDAAYYMEDTLIGAPDVPEQMGSNLFGSFDYLYGNFKAGARFEAYQPPMVGYDARYRGSGIPYKYLSYANDGLEFTIGNYYEQFGSGMILRTYEDRNLGIDNSLEGVRIKYSAVKGLALKGLVGRQRDFWGYGPGLVRGGDAELEWNSIFSSWESSEHRFRTGGGWVSRYQADNNPFLNLPENVMALSGRLNYGYKNFRLESEAAYKINDPNLGNRMIYKEGQGLVLNGYYSTKGISTSLGFKRLDNMDFRSDRNASVNQLTVNYLPAFGKQHTYQLAAFYPYATQPNGEMGVQGDLAYRFKRDTRLGGKYGTYVAVNYARIHNLQKTLIDDTVGYSSDFFAFGPELLFRDLNVEVQKKFSKNVSGNFQFLTQIYDKDRIQQQTGYGKVSAQIVVADLTFRLPNRNSLRTEAQHLSTEQDFGDWAMVLGEYNIKGKFFIAAFDQYNYGNKDSHKRIHYVTTSAGYIKGATRLAMGYGKQREGIVCVGGVCRQLPATNGFFMNLTTSF